MKTRKELKAAYKEQKANMGVFQIRNTTNGKLLIEGSTDMQAKWNRHRTELRFGSHRNKPLQKDWKTDTEAAFEFEILSELELKADSTANPMEEVKALKEMVLEELNLDAERRY